MGWSSAPVVGSGMLIKGRSGREERKGISSRVGWECGNVGIRGAQQRTTICKDLARGGGGGMCILL